MPHKFNPSHKSALDDPGRSRLLPPRELLEKMGLSAGQAFLDVGAGTGFFTFPALEIVGKGGHVMAVDISRDMIMELLERSKNVSSSNLDILYSSEGRLQVQSHSVDFALAAFVLHEAEDVDGLLADIRRALKPGGILAVLEWEKKETKEGPPLSDRLDGDKLAVTLSEAGFKASLPEPCNPFHYRIIARKDSA